MKTKTRSKQTSFLKLEVRNGRVSLVLSLSTRWLIVSASVLGALLSSTPIVELIQVILKLLQ